MEKTNDMNDSTNKELLLENLTIDEEEQSVEIILSKEKEVTTKEKKTQQHENDTTISSNIDNNNEIINTIEKQKVEASSSKESMQNYIIKDDEVYIYDEEKRIPYDRKHIVKQIVVKEGILSIPDTAFYECKSLMNIQLPSTLTSIGERSFFGCEKLESVAIPEGVTTIPAGAFKNCHSLAEVKLPTTITSIEEGAFNGCYNLKKINIPNNIRSIGYYTFSNCFELTNLVLPESITSIGYNAFENCYKLEAANLPKLKTIENSTFRNCYALRELMVKNVETIQRYAIWNCYSLRSLILPSTFKSISKDNFGGCINLRSDEILLPTSLEDENRIRLLNNMKEDPWSIENKKELRSNIYLKDGPGADNGFKGQSQRGYGPQYWGITREQLKDIRKHPLMERKDENGKYTFTMREFVDLELIPLTDGLRMGYALLINQGKPQLVKTMVSHAWDEAVIEFIDAILASDDEGPFWICAFSIYQNYDEAKGPTVSQQLSNDPEFGPFATVLRCVDKMIAVITFGCNIYTRLWCVFEMYFARKLGVKVSLAPYGVNVNSGYFLNDVCIAGIGDAVNSILARCGNPIYPMNEDEKMIRKVIENSIEKFAGVDAAVEGIRMEYLVMFNTEKIEYYKTYGLDKLKAAIETMIPRLPENDKLIKYESYLQDQLTSHPGFQQIEKLTGPEMVQGRHDYYIVNSKNKDEKIDMFQGWLKVLKRLKVLEGALKH